MSTRNTAALSLLPAALVIGTLSLETPSARGQSVVAPTTPVANQALNDSLLEAGLSPSATALTSPLQWASIAVRPHLHYRYLYGDGIRSGPGQQTKTTIQTISPGVLFEIGSRWSLDYTATQYYYSKDNFRDRLDHSARTGDDNFYVLRRNGSRYLSRDRPARNLHRRRDCRSAGADLPFNAAAVGGHRRAVVVARRRRRGRLLAGAPRRVT